MEVGNKREAISARAWHLIRSTFTISPDCDTAPTRRAAVRGIGVPRQDRGPIEVPPATPRASTALLY